VPSNSSSFADSVSMNGFSFAVIVSQKMHRMRACPVSNASHYNYCPLIGALYLLWTASVLFGLYDDSIKAFKGIHSLELDEKVMITSLVENLGTLQFIVPAVMLGVAINLITEFLKTSSPLKHSNK
jgi:hypothetical protein